MPGSPYLLGTFRLAAALFQFHGCVSSGLPTSEDFTCASQSDVLTVASAVNDAKAADTDFVAIILKATTGRHSTTVVTTS